MLQLKTCVSLHHLRLPFRQAVAKAAELGADAVVIDARREIRPREMSETGIRDLKRSLENYGLRVAGVSYRTRRGYHVEQELDERVSGTKEAMSFAYKLGARVAINHIGLIPESQDDRHWELLVDTLRDIGFHGQHCGAVLAARTGSEDGATMLRLLETLPDGTLGVAFDPGSLLMNGFSASEAIGHLSRFVSLVCATDAVRDLGAGQGRQMPLGQGAVDYPELLSQLEQSNYLGYFCVEPAGGSRTDEEMAAGIEYFKAM